jgi:UDP-glucose 4-epimerase
VAEVTWLVTGGAGYIGAHVVDAMSQAGEELVVLDDLTTGDRARLPAVPVVVGTILDDALVRRVMREHRVTGVVHIAGKKRVDESVERPLFYYRQNVEGTRALLEAAVACGAESFVFSSSAAVYGCPDVELVSEQSPCLPVNPYGRSKLIGEQMVRDVATATGLRYACLRYFNVAGAGSRHLADRGVTNLIPMVFRELAQRRAPRIFGADYATPDGTCIRDFVHVADIASAHVAAARALAQGERSSLIANIGRREGVSVRQMVDLILRITGSAGEEWARPIVLPRRPGDPPRVVASADLIRDALGWTARWDAEEMVASAWDGWRAAGHASTPNLTG